MLCASLSERLLKRIPVEPGVHSRPVSGRKGKPMPATTRSAWPVSISAGVPIATPHGVGASCMRCSHTPGIPYAVAIRAGQRTVSFRCPACLGTWERTAPDLPASWLGVS